MYLSTNHTEMYFKTILTHTHTQRRREKGGGERIKCKRINSILDEYLILQDVEYLHFSKLIENLILFLFC